MKTLKFRYKLKEKILNGDKTITWRLFDDKNLETGDRLTFLDWENREEFAKAEVINLKEKKIKELTEVDCLANDYQNQDEALKNLREYYGDGVTVDTLVKIIEFKLL